jgi:cyanophycinase
MKTTVRLRVLAEIVTLVLLLATVPGLTAQNNPYQYFRMGNSGDVAAKTSSGFALMGGGKDQDTAFQWMCEKSGGGDFLIIRATGTDDYDDYIMHLCHQNSVSTLIIPSREAALDPFVAMTIRNAEALFIAGGDQANYVRNWQDTPVQDAINNLIRRGVPVGGTSAGLAVLGEFSYSALNDGKPGEGNLTSEKALSDPYSERVTITRNFIQAPILSRTITDTHFVSRNRLGRLLAFMARINQDQMAEDVRGIGVDERSVVLLDDRGNAQVVGSGSGAYFFRPTQKPAVCSKGLPLTYRTISVYKVAPGASFNVVDWSGSGGVAYTLDVERGVVQSSQESRSLY